MAGEHEAVTPATADMVRIGSSAALRDDGILPARAEGVDIVVLRHGASLRAFQGHCPHRGTLLAEGAISNGVLTCRGHGWRFDCGTGANVDQPGICLKRFECAVEGDDVLVDRTQVLAWKRQTDDCGGVQSTTPARPLEQLPGPAGLPWLGNLLQLHHSRMHSELEQWCAAFGPIYRINLARLPAIVVADGEWIDRILHDRPETFRRARAVEALTREVGDVSVFAAEGETWRRHRRPVAQALDARHLRDFFPTLAGVTRRLKRRWEQAAADGLPVHVQQDLKRYAVDVTASLAFGHDTNTLEGEGGPVQQHLERILPMFDRRLNALFPYWHYVRLPADRAYDKAVQALRKFIGEMIVAARERLAQAPDLAAHPRNFLEAMVAAQAADDAPLSDEELIADSVTMLLAGEDTTANTISWILYFMCIHPDVQRRMQEEAAEVLGTTDVLADIHEASRLVYLDAVVHESLRLKPVAPLLHLESNRDVEIAGFVVPRGTLVLLLTRPNVLRDNSFAAALEFRPERWLESSAAAHHRSGFVPFGSGPRLCPGRSLALLEAKAALS
ncbi:cytochrome P450, partial [Cupriavidus lacunae]